MPDADDPGSIRSPARRLPKHHRLLRLVAAAAVTVVAVAGCGSDGSSDRAPAGRPETGAETGPKTDEVVSVEHKYGTTQVTGRPERIVSLDTQWTDVLIAMGAPPLGYGLDPTSETGTFPWRGDALDGREGIKIVNAIPFERVAALAPDLIVVSFAAQDEADYERLSQIAPTIPLLGTKEVDAWQDMAKVAGSILGDPERAANLVAEAEQLTADVRAEHPGLDGKTFAMANYVAGDGIYVVADPEDGSSVFFEQLGLSITPTILGHADGASGRVELSMENASLLDADLLVLFTNGADPDEIPGYDALPAVRDRAIAVLDYAAVAGLNTPTPLSIPYSLDLIRPALDAAAS